MKYIIPFKQSINIITSMCKFQTRPSSSDLFCTFLKQFLLIQELPQSLVLPSYKPSLRCRLVRVFLAAFFKIVLAFVVMPYASSLRSLPISSSRKKCFEFNPFKRSNHSRKWMLILLIYAVPLLC